MLKPIGLSSPLPSASRSDASRSSSEAAPVDQLVLNYAAFQFDDEAKKPNGAHHVLRQVKELALEQKDSRVAIFVQGYELSSSGKWQVARYLVQGGEVRDLTSEIKGNRWLYSSGKYYEKKQVVGKETCQGAGVTMMDTDTFRDFFHAGISRFPSARYVTFANNTHGNGSGGLAAEAVIEGELHPNVREKMKWNDCQQVLSEAAELRGGKLDLISFDSCVMGQFEVLNSLTQVAHQVIASPEVEVVPDSVGLPSPQALIPSFRHLVAQPETTPEQLAQRIWQTSTTESKYRGKGSQESDCTPTLGIYGSQKLAQAAAPLGELGEALHQALEDPQKKSKILEAVKDAFAYPHQASNFFGGDPLDLTFKDLRSFLKPLKETLDPQLLERVESSMEAAAPSFFRGSMGYHSYAEVGTVSVFLPDVPRDLAVSGTHISDLNRTLSWQRKRGLKPELLSSDVSEVVDRRRDYLEVFKDSPQPHLQAALEKHQEAFQRLEETQKALRGIYNQAAREAILLPQQESLWSDLCDLHDGLKDVDIASFVKSHNQKVDDGIKARFQKQYQEKLSHNLQEYSQIEGLPPGWLKFVTRLGELMVAEVLPEVLKGVH